MRNKEQSDAITSGQHGPKLPGLGRAPTSGVCGLWPQRHCLPFSDTPENGAKNGGMRSFTHPPFLWPASWLEWWPPRFSILFRPER